MHRVSRFQSFLTMVALTLLATVPAVAGGPILIEDHFSYADGSLVSASAWENHSGTMGDLLVASGQAVVQHGAPSEDAHLDYADAAGTVYLGFAFSIDDLGAPYSGTDNEYFIHFREEGTFNFVARVDVVEPSGAGDFTLGIATSGGTADATWASDLTFGTTYKVIVAYDQVADQAELWIDPADEMSTSILGADLADPGVTANSVALRQSDSSENETIRIDDIVVGTDFDAVLALVPVELQSFSIE